MSPSAFHKHHSPPTPIHRHQGFTLAEMAIVLLIISILAGGVTAGLSARLRHQAEQRTDQALAEAHDALLGHLVRFNRLPCPAKSPTDGSEDFDGTHCTRLDGLLPWASLGIKGEDGWSRRLRYAVSDAYVRPLTKLEAGNIGLITRRNDGSELNLTTTAGATPAVVLSHGANGLGGTHTDGSAMAPPIPASDEARNAASGTHNFYSRVPSDNPAAPGGAFDDRLTWLSPHSIAYLLAASGRLP